MIIHISLDDFDSKRGGCTTHLAFLIVNELFKRKIEIIDYPRLVRLNPDVPWKTRGNAAVSIKVSCNKNKLDLLKNLLKKITDKYYTIEENTNPGVILYLGNYVPDEFKKIYNQGVYTLIPLSRIYNVLHKYRENIIYWIYGTGRGLVGAAAALGADLWREDHTFEILVYRPLSKTKRERDIDAKYIMEDELQDTFANFDYETGKPLITPHGPDPIVFGIRGESPLAVYNIFKKVKINEEIEGWMIFVTNQGTFKNLYNRKCKICEIQPYTQNILKGVLIDNVVKIPGGHLLLKLCDGSGTIDVMAYEPSGRLREIIELLKRGDRLIIGGGVKIKEGRLTMNIQIIWTEGKNVNRKNSKPICPKCHTPMQSLGYYKGLICKRCRYHIKFNQKIIITRKTHVIPEIIEPPLRSIRHLTKPLKRIGFINRKKYKLIDGWFKYLR